MASLALIAGCQPPGSELPNGGDRPAPQPTWTQSDSDACAAADLALLAWDDDVGATAYHLFWADLGDVATARKQAGAAAAKYVKIAAALKVPPVAADELAAVKAALAAGVTAFKAKMTVPQFKAAYGAIDASFKAFEDQCGTVENWVTQNVPQ